MGGAEGGSEGGEVDRGTVSSTISWEGEAIGVSPASPNMYSWPSIHI